MELYLLRHGAAEERSPAGSDAARKLTRDGREAVERNVKRAATLGMRPEVILSSPYARAMETAEIAARLLGYEDPIVQSRKLEPDSTPAELWAEARLHSEAAAVLLVSHEPLLSSALAWLQGISEALAPFAAGALARLDIRHIGPVPRAQMRWLIQ